MNAFRRPRLRFATTALLALLAAPLPPLLAQGDVAEESDEAAVVLPPFIVDDGKTLRWRYATVPGIEILTTGTVAVTRDYLTTLQRQQQLVRQLIPDRFLWSTTEPVKYVVVESSSGTTRNNAVLQSFFAQERRALEARNQEARFIPNLRLSDTDGSAVFSTLDGIGNESRPFDFNAFLTGRPSRERAALFQFTSDRIRFLLTRRTPALPVWLATGLTGVYHNCDFGADRVQVRTAVWRSPAEADALRLDPDRPRDILPLDLLLVREPPAPGTPLRRIWDEQAVLFVRWALFAQEDSNRDALWKFADLLDRHPADEDLFRECFGLGFADARDLLSDYLPRAISEAFALDPPEIESSRSIPVRLATPAEIGRVRGDWERLVVNYVRRNQPELTPAYLRSARATLGIARRDAGELPDLLAVSGLLEFDAGETDAARRDLEAAVAGGSRRPRALWALARLRFDAAIATLPAEGRLDPAQTAPILQLIEAAQAQSPALFDGYVLLGDVWLRSELQPSLDQLDALEQGLHHFPYQPAVVARTALVLASSGQLRWALDVLRQGAERARDDTARQQYRELSGRLQLVTVGTR